MSFLIGTRIKLIGKEPSQKKCSRCEKNLNYSIYSNFIHVLLIFRFTFSKIYRTECENCKLQWHYPKKNADDRMIQFQLGKKFKHSLFQNSGYLLLPLMLVGVIYLDKFQEQKYEQYFENPLKGDVYFVHDQNQNYTTMKIDSVFNDSLYFLLNDYVMMSNKDLYQLDRPRNYGEIQYYFEQQFLDSMRHNKHILRIKRTAGPNVFLKKVKEILE